MNWSANYGFSSVPTRSIFVSYHHTNDQAYYDEFSRAFSGSYGVLRDNSLDRAVDSDNADYVMQRIREKHITGTSCTFVLCGPETRLRKYVDWEVKATLDKAHGLVGVQLPNLRADYRGLVYLPTRLNENINSKYALWIGWADLAQGGSPYLQRVIETAIARPASLIVNPQQLKQRNG